MTCWQCSLHESDVEHVRDVTEKVARLSEGFCMFCAGRADVRDGRGYHCGMYQSVNGAAYTVSTS